MFKGIRMNMAELVKHNEATHSANEGDSTSKDHSSSPEIGCED